MTLEDFRPLVHHLVELTHGFRMVVLKRHERIRLDRQTDGRTVQQRDITRDVTIIFEAAQPAPARRGRQADSLGELLV